MTHAEAMTRRLIACGMAAVLAAVAVGCHSVRSERTSLESIGWTGPWTRRVPYALPRTTIEISIPVVEITMWPGPFCAEAAEIEGVVDPPEDDAAFCDRPADEPLVRFALGQPVVEATTRVDEARIYTIDRLPLPGGLDLESALARYGLLTGAALSPPPAPAPPEVSTPGPRKQAPVYSASAVRPADAKATALLIHRLQESRLAMVSGYRPEIALPDRDTLELMLAETDHAIEQLSASFVRVERRTQWIRVIVEPIDHQFSAPAGEEAETGWRIGREARYEIFRFDVSRGLRPVDPVTVEGVRVAGVPPEAVPGGAVPGKGDKTVGLPADGVPVIVSVRLDPWKEQPAEDAETEEEKEESGILYRSGRNASVSLELGSRRLVERRIRITHLGPIRVVTSSQLVELDRAPPAVP